MTLASLLAPAMHAPHLASHVMLIVLAALAGVVGATVAVQAARERTSVPLLLMLGGVVALPIEPLWDVICHFEFPFDTHPHLFTELGRPIPLYLAFVYPFFIGWGSYLAYRLIDRGAGARTMLRCGAAFVVLDAVIEIVGIRTHVWRYYDHQAFTVLGWPAYFGVLNGAIPVLAGSLAAVLHPRLSAAGRVLVLPTIVPTAYVGIYAVAGWPTWAALGSNVGRGVVWLAGAITIAYCVAIVRCVVASVCTPQPSTERPRAARSWIRTIGMTTGAGT